MYVDMTKMEEAISSSLLEWTIVRAPHLVVSGRCPRYRAPSLLSAAAPTGSAGGGRHSITASETGAVTKALLAAPQACTDPRLRPQDPPSAPREVKLGNGWLEEGCSAELSRADLAAFILRELQANEWVRRRPYPSY
jgi:hypothetical protein